MTLLHEISVRWRIPVWTRLVLFLDVVASKFLDQEVSLETLDAAFEYAREGFIENGKSTASSQSSSSPYVDRSTWTIADFALMRRLLTSLHDALLRDLYDTLQHCYEQKPPSVGAIMYVLDHHIRNDPSFSVGQDEDARFTAELSEGLRQKALNVYSEHLHAEVPENQDEWHFFHVVQLGKAILKLAERIQKRYKKNPEVMG